MYETLFPCRREIRLVTLLHGGPFENICCELSTVSLDTSPPYRALSYVWGDRNNEPSITLDGLEFPITANLYAALRRLREATVDQTLWIDAICINQRSLSEKSQQIPLMRSIYENAKEVIVWLGEASEDSGTAIDLLNTLSERSGDRFVWETEEHGNAGASTAYIRESFVALFNRDWWQRTWVVQEIFLAKYAQVFCGSHSTSWDDLESGFTKTLLYAMRTEPLSKLLQGINGSQILGLMKFSAAKGPASNQKTLLQLLNSHAARAVTNPRDKIYAMLGLTTDPPHTLPIPNYNLPVEEVYRQTTLDSIKHSRSLEALNYVDDPEQNSPYPSWARDWTKECRAPSLLGAGERCPFKAAATTKPRMKDSKDPNILILIGLHVDDVVETSEPADFRPGPLRFYRKWEDFAHMEDPFRPYVGGGDFCNAFWRTIIGNTVMGSTDSKIHDQPSLQARENDRMAFLVYSGRARVPEDFMKNHKHEGERHARYTVNFSQRMNISNARRLFKTKAGYLGIGPTSMKQGDQVCVLLGGATPFIL